MLEKDWSKLTDAELQYELELCEQVLHGHEFFDGKEMIKMVGLEDSNYKLKNGKDIFFNARKVWRQRLANAQRELLERNLLKED